MGRYTKTTLKGARLTVEFTVRDLNRLNTDRYLPEVLDEITEEVEFIVIDMMPVSFIDSKGMSGLLEIQIAAENLGARVFLLRLNSKSRQVFKSLGIDRHFQLVDTEDEIDDLVQPG